MRRQAKVTAIIRIKHTPEYGTKGCDQRLQMKSTEITHVALVEPLQYTVIERVVHFAYARNNDIQNGTLKTQF